MTRAGELDSSLQARLAEIAAALEEGALAVTAYDYCSKRHWSFNGARWFHAASTIKIAILAAVFDAIDAGRFTPDSRLAVRNRFSSAVDGAPFRVQASRDADSEVHAAIGRTMQVRALARHMMVTSSNLATNLLLDLIGLDASREALARRGIPGIDLQRGVEDDRAFEAGRNNRVTSDGLVRLLRVLCDHEGFTASSAQAMLDILFDQHFDGGIGPGLPESVRAVARVAHKTGDISTVTHDAGLVFLPGRPPYVLAILTENGGDATKRTQAMTTASRLVYEAVSEAGASA